ncbi:MAG: phosphoadenosine phosphosulfate reductase family protein [Candidatus Glassbacteria bacterium]|nr:phosphoadenosine phosphosulfate reductase family protein [Candidatus Glassbacteria bacterium]
MAANPYRIETPALVSFSGGKSSGYMLRHVLDAYDGKLPDDVHVVFCNTGKEMPQTLEYVAELAEWWAVKIVWLEYDPEVPHKTKQVGFTTAKRDGTPFEQLIRNKNFLPNPVTRHCTSELKVKRMISWMRDTCGYEEWVNAIGLRADEPFRVASQKARNASGKERFETVMPMADAGVRKKDVVAFWGSQDFNLRLPSFNGTTPAGNCDLCFMKSAYVIQELIRERPDLASWWIEMESLIDKPKSEDAAIFRIDRPIYSRMLKAVEDQDLFDFPEMEEVMPCLCHD